MTELKCLDLRNKFLARIHPPPMTNPISLASMKKHTRILLVDHKDVQQSLDWADMNIISRLTEDYRNTISGLTEDYKKHHVRANRRLQK